MDKTKISNIVKKCTKVIKHASEQYGSQVLLGAIAYGVFKAGNAYTELCISRGIERFHKAGLVKFFDYDGKEINIIESTKLLSEHIEELKKIPID